VGQVVLSGQRGLIPALLFFVDFFVAIGSHASPERLTRLLQSKHGRNSF